MTERYPILSNVEQTLQRWRIELTRTQDLAEKAKDTFIFKDWTPNILAGTRVWTTEIIITKYIEIGGLVFFQLFLEGTVTGAGAAANITVSLPVIPAVRPFSYYGTPDFVSLGFTNAAIINTQGRITDVGLLIADVAGAAFNGATAVGFNGFYRVGLLG